MKKTASPATEEPASATGSLPVLMSLASLLLTLISLLALCFAPVFHADLGDYTPETEEEIDLIITMAPDLEQYKDKGFSVDYSFIDFTNDSNKEGDLKKAIENEDLAAIAEAMEGRGAYSAAISALSIREYYDAYQEYMSQVAAGNDSARAPIFERHGEYYEKVNNAGVLTFIILIFMGIAALVEIIIFLRGLAKKVKRTSLRKNGIFIFSIILTVMQLLLIVFNLVSGAALNGFIALPLVLALLGIACPVVAVVINSRKAQHNAAKE